MGLFDQSLSKFRNNAQVQALSKRVRALEAAAVDLTQKSAQQLGAGAQHLGRAAGLEQHQMEALGERAGALSEKLAQKEDGMARSVAETLTTWTGREVSTQQVRRAATVAIVATIAANVAESIAQDPGELGWHTSDGDFAGGEDFGGEDIGGSTESGDAMDDARMMLAGEGSPMNDGTAVMDGDGVTLDHA